MSKNKKKRRVNEKIIYPHISMQGKGITVYDVRKNVEYMDKKFGLKLKDPNVWLDPESVVNIIESKANTNVIALMCGINGIDVKTFLQIDGISAKDIYTKNRKVEADRLFSGKAVIKWNSTDVYGIRTLEFKARFVTLMLSKFAGRVGIIADNMLKEKNVKHSYAENKIMLMKEIMQNITRFVYCVLTQDSYKNILLLMERYLGYSRNKYKFMSKTDLYNDIIYLRHDAQISLFGPNFKDVNVEDYVDDPEIVESIKYDIAHYNGRGCPDDIIIEKVIRHAFVLATGSDNLKHVPKYRELEGATLDHDLIKVIEKLGIEILKNRKKGKYYPSFRAFLDARPQVYSGYHRQARENIAIAVGIMAIEHVDFLYNDNQMRKICKKMITPGK